MTLLCSTLGAVTVGCAGGGSSATQPATVVPAAVQGAPAIGSAARQAHSCVRRTLATSCSGTGTGAFVGGAGGNGSGGYNPNVAKGLFAFVGAGSGNDACDAWSTIAGGYDNVASGTGEDAFIGAGENNLTTGYDLDSTIVAGNTNTVSEDESAIVAGFDNLVQTEDALIGTGRQNVISGSGDESAIVSGEHNQVLAKFGFIGAGTNNTVSGEGAYIAAGGYNTASGTGAVIDGGFNSSASGTFATIPGGYVNSAAGTYSFAAGARASAAQTGTFVWSDGSDGDTILASSRAYQFLARASGGVTFWTNAGSTVGATLAPGSGTWASASDRNLKTDVARIDDAIVLDKVAALPIERWSYKSERGVRHVGPMAQDFYAAFGVGEDDKHITSIDEDGVALAAIKALHARVGALGAENARLRAQLSSTDARLAKLSAAVAALTAR
ncbi:MAG TPA: tail fiber domain-containing protein [Candidatus Elarobacter sp.]|nr:tail fiber domain-containing protein [Candidatus Elarobacter sp.]